jgi:hypothetical protein
MHSQFCITIEPPQGCTFTQLQSQTAEETYYYCTTPHYYYYFYYYYYYSLLTVSVTHVITIIHCYKNFSRLLYSILYNSHLAS